MNRGLIALIVIIIIIIIGGVYLFSQSNDQKVQNNTTQNITVQNNTQTTNQTNNTSNNTVQTNISSEQARQIALQFIDEPGAYPGTPTLSTWPDGRLVWNVPVIQNGQIVSGINIDAQTGANLGKG